MANNGRNAMAFSQQLMRHTGVALPAFLDAVLVEFCTMVYQAVVFGGLEWGNPNGTPVKTSFARASWYVTNASAERSSLPIHGKPPSGTAPETYQAMATGQQQLSLAKIVALKSGTAFYLTCGADYGIMLEFGWSGQAPNGMVRLVLQDAQAMLNAAGLAVLARVRAA